jgi:hypothetical protein
VALGLLFEVFFLFFIRKIRRLARSGNLVRGVNDGVQVVPGVAVRPDVINLDTTVIQATEMNDVQGYSSKDLKKNIDIPVNQQVKMIDFTVTATDLSS